MGRNLTNRGQIGIQPVPIDDLKLQGYVPKTLYVPDDVSVGVSISAGLHDDTVRVLKCSDDGTLYTRHNSSVLNYSKDQVHRFIDPIDVFDGYVKEDIWLPDGNTFLLYIAFESVTNDADNMTFGFKAIDSSGHIYLQYVPYTISTSVSGVIELLALSTGAMGHHFNLLIGFDDFSNTATIHVDIEDISY